MGMLLVLHHTCACRIGSWHAIPKIASTFHCLEEIGMVRLCLSVSPRSVLAVARKPVQLL